MITPALRRFYSFQSFIEPRSPSTMAARSTLHSRWGRDLRVSVKLAQVSDVCNSQHCSLGLHRVVVVAVGCLVDPVAQPSFRSCSPLEFVSAEHTLRDVSTEHASTAREACSQSLLEARLLPRRKRGIQKESSAYLDTHQQHLVA